jgi:hypothetical protein
MGLGKENERGGNLTEWPTWQFSFNTADVFKILRLFLTEKHEWNAFYFTMGWYLTSYILLAK